MLIKLHFLKIILDQNGQALKNCLKQSGKISEIKSKLKGLDTVLKKKKELTPLETSEEKV